MLNSGRSLKAWKLFELLKEINRLLIEKWRKRRTSEKVAAKTAAARLVNSSDVLGVNVIATVE
jgi:hypothetical protein